ncbi:O-methyltransferase [Talaromyces proteolyticus]|uniref:O-methyltransferase n=1 Tax=Talaromyces proteolyticus TaxID=1131652 RepID=A0AAD4KUZ9_9EURO|nr:O-methyltransferase [Talaromyces proteolyticus]KAH8696539.1 O-methyltransferase [Talaromyces proteolyticus]
MYESIIPFPAESASTVDKYCCSHSTSLPSLFADHAAWTVDKFETSYMMCCQLQAQMCVFIASDRRARRVLEIGTFTGYSALAWKEGMKAVGGEVWTCDVGPRAIAASKEAFAKYDPEGKIHLVEGPALQTLQEINAQPFDIIYIDARKAEYINYVETILERNLLAENGIILADDTIHLGLVADRSPTNPHSAREDIEYSLQHADNVHKFNEWAAKHPRLEVLLLPIFNGLTLIKIKS